jgi:alginate O-acetyltransferase complex protein AlgI
VLDAYLNRAKPTASLLDYLLYVAFFPHLVAGPIVRAPDFVPQLTTLPQFGMIRWRPVLTLFMLGFCKKAVLSDNIAPYVDGFFDAPNHFCALDSLLAVVLYAIQIYCDFSGYSDMGIAVAAFFGYRLCVNFDHPYFSTNIAEFWRRWHISLSSWLCDYLYICLWAVTEPEN